MSHDEREVSTYDAAPVELYEFRGLDGTTYRYTSSPVNVQRGGQLFEAASVDRNQLKAGTQDGDKHNLEITLPARVQLVLDYATRISPPKLDLTIYRYHEGEDPVDDAIIYWVGPVVTFKISGDLATVTSTSIFGTALGGNIPSVYFQSPCNWVLYDGQCQVNRAAWEFTDQPVDVGNNVIKLSAIPPQYSPSDFNGGEIACARTGERRMIVLADGVNMTINYPFSDLTTTDDITVSAGCDHSFETCRDKFNNPIRFGGDRFIPYVNPFAEGL